ncbi:MAG: hypothetical protein AMJ54_15895 [Deltaproteobacteria bacterium SG8_13]|nr:MAG: hypothetical protein AMJ54_15895 [Deltaproteobacteria bacterium SG8_13]
MTALPIRKTVWKHYQWAVFIALAGCWLVPASALHRPQAMAADPAMISVPAAAGCTSDRRMPLASPVVLANVLYTAFPDGSLPQTEEETAGGRMAAVRIYDPEIPDQPLTGDQILWEVGQALAAGDPDKRRIWFADAGAMKPFTVQTVTARMLALDTKDCGANALRCDFNSDGENDSDDLEHLIRWVRQPHRAGDGKQRDWPLGSVDQSVPALMIPPQAPDGWSGFQVEELQRRSFRRFSAVHRERRTVLFVGSADGLLHAIDAGSFRWGDNPATPDIVEQGGHFRWEPTAADAPDYCFAYDGSCPNYGTGRELWAFIPSNLLPRLKYHLVDGGIPASMNASPAIADVYLDSDGDGIADTWRTVLLSAQGSEGDGVFCLDVTDPHRPVLMWEHTAAELARRKTPPAVVRIGRILDRRTGRPRWAAFLVSAATEATRQFPAVLIFDISTGRPLERIVLDAAADRNGDGLLQADELTGGRDGVAGSRPAIVDSDGNGLIDRIYVSSDKGLVYKVVLTDQPGRGAAGITHCVLNTDFTAADGRMVAPGQRYQPVIVSPTVITDDKWVTDEEGQSRVWIFFGTAAGTGGKEGSPSDGHRNYFFAYTDDAGKNDCRPQRHQLQWFIELDAGQHLPTEAFAAAGRVYFGAASTAHPQTCGNTGRSEAESGHLVAVDLDGTVLLERSIPEVLSAPLVQDRHLYLTLPGGPLSFGAGVYNTASLSTGRVQVRIKAWQEVE